MAISFRKLIRPSMQDVSRRMLAEDYLTKKPATQTLVFLSHKTGDTLAEKEARYIAGRHSVLVYIAEWDDRVSGDSAGLPDHIMSAIQRSDGFLLNVIPEIGTSMWIGYEIGGAHAMKKRRAKIMYERVGGLPSVVGALPSLNDRMELDRWILKFKSAGY